MKWSALERFILKREWERGTPIKQIAYMLTRSQKGVMHQRKYLQLPTRRPESRRISDGREVRVRFASDDLNALRRFCRSANISLAEFIRKATIERMDP